MLAKIKGGDKIEKLIWHPISEFNSVTGGVLNQYAATINGATVTISSVYGGIYTTISGTNKMIAFKFKQNDSVVLQFGKGTSSGSLPAMISSGTNRASYTNTSVMAPTDGWYLIGIDAFFFYTSTDMRTVFIGSQGGATSIDCYFTFIDSTT